MQSFKRLLTLALVVLDVVLFFGGFGEHAPMYQWVGRHLATLMTNIAQVLGGPNAIGWSVIIITAVFRLILLPLMLNQQAVSTVNQIKMQILKPELDKVQAAVKTATTPAEQQQASMGVMRLYRENNVSLTGGINWITMLAQLPLFSGIYSAIYHTPSLREASFFGINLAHSSWLLALLAGAVYLVQSYLTMLHVPEEQKAMTRPMMMLMPVMMIVFTLLTNASIGLYFVVGGLFALLQSLINHYQRPGLEKAAAEGFKLQVTADDILAATNTQPAKDVTETVADDTKKLNRNAGKQKRDE